MADTRFRSAAIREGVLRAATRSFLYALAKMTRISIAPMSPSFTPAAMSPCKASLREQALQAKAGIYANGGTPHECPVVSISDGPSIAHPGMRFSLVLRELIADSVEATVQAHQWDGMFGIGGCDKNLPGLLDGPL